MAGATKPVISQVPWSLFTGAGASVTRSRLAPAPWPGFTFTCGFSGVLFCTLPWWVSSLSPAWGPALPQSSDACSKCLQIYFLGTFLLSVVIAWMVLYFQCVSGKAFSKAKAGGKRWGGLLFPSKQVTHPLFIILVLLHFFNMVPNSYEGVFNIVSKPPVVREPWTITIFKVKGLKFCLFIFLT